MDTAANKKLNGYPAGDGDVSGGMTWDKKTKALSSVLLPDG
jgi:hypothetical protein